MNKSEKLIVVLLGLVLAGWVWHTVGEQKKVAKAQAQQVAKASREGKLPRAAAESGTARNPGDSRKAVVSGSTTKYFDKVLVVKYERKIIK